MRSPRASASRKRSKGVGGVSKVSTRAASALPTSERTAWSSLAEGGTPNALRYRQARSSSVRISWATWRDVAPSWRASRIGRTLCADRLSGAPDHPTELPSRRFMSVGVLRSTSATAAPRVRLSVQLRSGTWQVPQENLPLPERRLSKNSRSPKSTAPRLPEAGLPGSLRSGTGQGPWARMARVSLSLSGAGSSAAPPGSAAIAARTARAQPNAVFAVLQSYDGSPFQGEYE